MATAPHQAWQEETDLRQKLILRGSDALTDGELLSLLIAEPLAVDPAAPVGRDLLRHFGGLAHLARATLPELLQYPTLDARQAFALFACFELARRRQRVEHRHVDIASAATVAAYLKPKLMDLEHEAFWVLFLNRANQLVAEKMLATGGVSATVIDPKLIFKEAVLRLASAIIVAHNHPSGTLTPSEADLQLTRQLRDAGRLLDIALLDHLIISYKGYFSFADEGLLA